MSAMSERACTAHSRGTHEAETVREHGLTYLVIRCDVCNRPQGMRLVRRVWGEGGVA
jgi:hypothetical protein